MSKNKCQAKDPSSCRYHGTELRMNAAMAAGDLDTYFKERAKFEELTPETDQTVKEGLGEFVDVKLFNPFTKRRNKQLEANPFSAEGFEDIQTNFANTKYNVLETLNIKPNDKLAFSRATNYGHTELKRKVYKQENGKWVYVGYGIYHDQDVANLAEDYGLEGNQNKAWRITVLIAAARNQLENHDRV